MNRSLSLSGRCTFVSLMVLSIAMAVHTPACGQPPNFQQHIKPIFRSHCAGCHNQQRKRGGLALDKYASVMEGGASGSVIEAGDLDQSRLWHLVNHDDQPSMPPDQDPIPQEQRDLIRAWISAGALEKSGDKAAAPKKSALAFVAPTVTPGEEILPKNLCQQPVEFPARPAAVPSIDISPVAPLLAIAAPQQVVLYHVDSGALLGILPFVEGMPEEVRFSADGSLLVAAGGRNSQRGWASVYEVKTGFKVAEVGDEIDTALAGDVNAALGRVALGGPQRLVRCYSMADGALVFESDKHNDWVHSVAYSPDGKVLATADRGGAIWLWEADTGRELRPLDGHTAGVHDLSWRSDSQVLASASEDGTVRLWEARTGKQIGNIKADAQAAIAVAFASNGHILTSGREKGVKLWDAKGKPVATLAALSDTGLSTALNANATIAVAADWQGNVVAWDVETKNELRRFAPNPTPLQQRLEWATTTSAKSAQLASTSSEQLLKLREQLATAERSYEEALSQAETASNELHKLSDETGGDDPKRDDTALAESIANLTKRADQAAKTLQQLTHQRAELTQQIDQVQKANATAIQQALADAELLNRTREAVANFERYPQYLAERILNAERIVAESETRVEVANRVAAKLEEAQAALKQAIVEQGGDASGVRALENNAAKELNQQAGRIASENQKLRRAQEDVSRARAALETFQSIYAD